MKQDRVHVNCLTGLGKLEASPALLDAVTFFENNSEPAPHRLNEEFIREMKILEEYLPSIVLEIVLSFLNEDILGCSDVFHKWMMKLRIMILSDRAAIKSSHLDFFLIHDVDELLKLFALPIPTS